MLTKNQRLELLRVEIAKKYPTMTKSQLQTILDTDLTLQKQDLKSSNQVAIAGWGTFKVVDRAARTARNPQTGQQMQIPASKAIRFRPAKDLRTLISGNTQRLQEAARARRQQAAMATPEAPTPRKNGRSRRREG